MTTTLPQFLRDLLASPPRQGEGVHRWLFRVARHLHPHYPDKAELSNLLAVAVEDCGRPVGQREIAEAIAHSAQCAWKRGAPAALRSHPSAWPQPNPGRIDAVVRSSGGLADLWELSTHRFVDDRPQTESVIDRLFPGNPLLCCGRSQFDFQTRSRAEWMGQLAQMQFMVPSPMSSISGLTQAGRMSQHALSNTGLRRYLICEFDQGVADLHAAVLMHLGRYAPLIAVVHSGGKSLHGWFLVAGQPDAQIEKFFRYAVSLGADRATWTRSQFVRMPDGLRENGQRQWLYFLNPHPLEANP